MWTISLAMATSHFRTLNEFHPGTESIKTYLERVQLHFTANSVADVRQVHILLSAIGSSNYVLLSDLVASETSTTKTLDEITAVLKKHYEPKRAVIAEKYHFYKRDQAMDESIAEYDAALRKLAIHCKFETYLEEALCDRFVCGLCNEAMQRRLLAETDLTLTKAIVLTQSMEAADHNSRAFKATEPTIKKISSRQPQCPNHNNPAVDAGKLAIKHRTAVSRMLTAMLVVRRATLLQLAGQNPRIKVCHLLADPRQDTMTHTLRKTTLQTQKERNFTCSN